MSWLERIRPVHLIVALVVLVVGIDVVSFPFYADDFHFLDVARHRPFLELMTGRYGIWPWYRPLSRELFFVLLTHVGPWGAPFGHAIETVVVAVSAVLIYRIATLLGSARAGAIAAMLFVTYEATKMLASWASGFQDLLALMLSLAAVRAMQRGRYQAVLVYAALAPLAKEPAFVVYPILLLFARMFDWRGEGRPGVRALAASAGVPVALHVIARVTWVNLATVEPAALNPPSVTFILGEALRFFVGTGPVLTFRSLAIAALAAGVAWLFARQAIAAADDATASSERRLVVGFAGATLLGAAPAAVGNAMFYHSNAYHLIPAVPWACMLVGLLLARAPAAFLRIAVPGLVVWNAAALGVAKPDLDTPAAWNIPNFTWVDAQRFAAVTRRFDADLHTLLADRPDHLVVLFQNLPPRTFIQTEDGPAVRELLRDPTLASYWSTETPWLPERRPVTFVTFDFGTLHLRKAAWGPPEALHRASNAIIAGRGAIAAATLRYAIPPGDEEPARSHLMAAAVLIAHGPEAYLGRLAAMGLADSTTPRIAAVVRALGGGDPVLMPGYQRMLEHPLSAQVYVALADSFAREGVTQGEAFELRMAITLDPTRWAERWRLAGKMVDLGGGQEALEELQSLAAARDAGTWAARAQAALDSLAAEGVPVASTRR